MVALSKQLSMQRENTSMTPARSACLLSLGLVVCMHGNAAPTSGAAYKNSSAAIEARVDDLLSRMTLAEKVAQMQCVWDAKSEVFDARLELDPKKMLQKYPD